MSEFHEENDELLDLEQTPSAEELQSQVKRAQSELLLLRQRQDQIEKEKQRLEELTQRQDDLERGRNEIADKLSRSRIPSPSIFATSRRSIPRLGTAAICRANSPAPSARWTRPVRPTHALTPRSRPSVIRSRESPSIRARSSPRPVSRISPSGSAAVSPSLFPCWCSARSPSLSGSGT